MMRQIWNRLQLLCAQGVGVMTTRDKVQVTVLDGEVPPNVQRVEPYGFSYRPPRKGFQTYLVFPAGDRSHGLCLIIGDKRYQMDLQEGEAALHDDEGNHVHIKRGGVIEVKAATKVIADTPDFETTGNAKVGGNLVVLGNTSSTGGFYGANGGVADMQGGLHVTNEFKVNGKNVGDGHTHTSTAPGSPTSGVN